MPVVINGSTGISGNDGTAAVPTIQGTDTNTGMFFPAADQIAFAEGGVESMRIDASGNVGIGTSSPGARLDVSGSIRASQSITIGNGAGVYQAGSIYSDGSWGMICRAAQSSPVIAEFLWANASDVHRMRIDTSGNLAFNSGYGSVATAYGCRAWVNFNGQGVVAIRASANVSSITDVGTGNYNINFSNAMPNVNYTVVGAASSDGVANNGFFLSGGASSYLTTSVGILTISGGSPGGNLYDAPVVNAAIFR